nr:lamin tail domain-containing protein [Schumannella luteola]
MTASECTPSTGSARNLPNSLDISTDQSWQRRAITGDSELDWVAAPATIDAPNATAAPARDDSGVVISEFATAGKKGSADDFVELRNDGSAPVDIGGWQLLRCTASGRLDHGNLQTTIAAGTELAPGARWLAAGTGFAGDADARYETGFADAGSGALLRTKAGLLADRVAVSQYGDSACQEGDAKLPAILDAVADESWQRAEPGSSAAASADAGDAAAAASTPGWIIAPRTPGAANATRESSVFRTAFAYPAKAERGVAISEIANDPGAPVLPAKLTQRNFIEIANYGERTIDVGGWTLRRCMADGLRAPAVQTTIPAGTKLKPGATWTVARAGTTDARGAQASYDTTLSFLGTGVWLADERGERVDSVGVYGRNELDSSIDTVSPCSKGLTLTTYLVDRMRGQSFQRVAFTGSDADDFRAAEATPGQRAKLDEDYRAETEARAGDTATGSAPAAEADTTASTAPTGVGAAKTDAAKADAAKTGAASTAKPLAGTAATVLRAWSGASQNGRLTAAHADGETPLDPASIGATSPADGSAPGASPEAVDHAYGYPYQRFELDATGLKTGSRIGWAGATTGRNELQLSVWTGSEWRRLAAGTDPTASGAPIALSGALKAGEIRDGKVIALVQDGPRTKATIDGGIDGRLENPDDYDLAISHVTDTQYLSDAYPEVYAEELSWIADNAASRKIAFATHTGDLVQNWVDPDQSDVRARAEFARASSIQGILDRAGVPNSVLPGNHDSKRGIDYTLFDEFFGPDRYAAQPWYGGSIAPGDNAANYSLISAGGADFLMLSLPYAYGEREIDWAERVVAAHPDRNVVVSTHEHLSPKLRDAPAQRSSSSRWVSRADELWDRVVAPNRNVIAVLSGHFHGIGQITTEDAGGLPGHDVVELLADYQEFRTHTGQRATGFQRLLQLDLASGTIAVDTFSTQLKATASYPYDYEQFLADNGSDASPSNDRPWNVIAAGTQDRYGDADDEFTAHVTFQYAKRVATTGLTTAGPAKPSTRDLALLPTTRPGRS